MRLSYLTFIFVWLSALGGNVFADESQIRKLINEKFPALILQEVTKIEGADLYELVVDGDVIYVDSNFRYLIDGNLIDLQTMKNLTRHRKSSIEARQIKEVLRPLSEFPLAKAIKKVNGSGVRSLAYFADPNCGYCKKFEREVLSKLEDTTIYLFPFPIIAESSVDLSKAIWCSSNRVKAWDDYVLRDVSPNNDSSCNNPIDEILAFGKKMRVRGTPTLFFVDGSRVPGMMPLGPLNEKLSSAN